MRSARSRTVMGVTLSLLLHFLLALLFIAQKTDLPPLPPAPASAIEVEVLKTQASQAVVSKGSKSFGSFQKQNRLKPFYPKLLVFDESNSFTVKSGLLGGGSILKPFGAESGDLKKLEDFDFYDFLYKETEGMLNYPWPLADKKIESVVEIQTRVLPGAKLDWQNLKISGGSPYFQLYVLRVLKTVFARSLTNQVRAQVTKTIPLDLVFTFQISENGDRDYLEKKKFIMGHVLAFHRVSHQSSLQWKIGPLEGLFPIPYVNLNVAKLRQMVTGEDPFAEMIANERDRSEQMNKEITQ